jgi:TPP-dependent pyruvate/acetoin dehydrogenase alpha subunit
MADLMSMWRLRAFEEKVQELRLAEEIQGSVHLAIGQEAVATGTASVLGEYDVLIATYRGHGWALACGVPAGPLFAELLGRASGVNGGRGGSAYLSAPEYRFLGENSIVGAGAPIAVGAALAGRYDKTNRTSVAVFGDGAMNQGAVHEAMNFASAMRLPVIFICENNRWSEMTPIDSMVGNERLYQRAAGYGMRGYRIDGTDPENVRQAVSDALNVARKGGGPVLIEAMTERLVGHYVGDVQHYRDRSDLDKAADNDPLRKAMAGLLREGIEQGLLDEQERRVRSEIEAAAQWALQQPIADGGSAREHIYA